MAKRRLTGATFVAASRTITHADFSDVTLAGIQLITNVTSQIIIYNFADTAKGGTLSVDTLTLEHDTTAMADGDSLMILVDDALTQTVNQGTSPWVVTGGGGGTQYAEDTALGATPTGTLSMLRRKDTLATLTPVADDAVSGRTNARGALWTAEDLTVESTFKSERITYTSAQTNITMISATGLKIFVKKITVSAGAGNSSTPAVRIGFHATATPTTTDVIFAHSGMLPGASFSEQNGGYAIGQSPATGDHLKITMGTITGTIDIVVTYYTV